MDFMEKLRLRGKAEEDRFFAELDKQLIEAMHEKQKLEEGEESLSDSLPDQSYQSKDK